VANDTAGCEWSSTPVSPVHLFAQDLVLTSPHERQALRLFAAQAVAAVLQHPVPIPTESLTSNLRNGGSSSLGFSSPSPSPSPSQSPAPLRRRSSLLLRLVHWRPGSSGTSGENLLSSTGSGTVAESAVSSPAISSASPPRFVCLFLFLFFLLLQGISIVAHNLLVCLQATSKW
jgi:hypothetical protein